MPDVASIGADERVSQAVGGTTTKYRWDLGWNVLNEEDNLGDLTRTYVGRSSAHVDGANPSTGTWRFYVHDHLGSTRGVYNSDKTQYAAFEHDPYGELYASSGSVSDITRRYTGHDWDDAAELYYAPYRYYAAGLARWITRDPLGMVDGPNVYGYVRMHPLNANDSLGLQGYPPYPWPLPGPAQPPPPPFPPEERAGDYWMEAGGYVGCITACAVYFVLSEGLLSPAEGASLVICLTAPLIGGDRDACFANVRDEVGQMHSDVWCNFKWCLDKCDRILEGESIIDWLGF